VNNTERCRKSGASSLNMSAPWKNSKNWLYRYGWHLAAGFRLCRNVVPAWKSDLHLFKPKIGLASAQPQSSGSPRFSSGFLEFRIVQAEEFRLSRYVTVVGVEVGIVPVGRLVICVGPMAVEDAVRSEAGQPHDNRESKSARIKPVRNRAAFARPFRRR
jgi:hypothetical protein